ncbi:MAG: DUF1127 domain-containing protein [Epibacterium sp.]|jgi:uncharacterized protein YjiS (DUF1127 family)|nr:DUF1127 domain-containing protein [Epibacterium sp.]NQX72901.1 DUF1127 domain-containing protein [Epibacterium sp.]
MAAIETSRPAFGAPGLTGRIGVLLAQAEAALSAWSDTRATRKALSGLTDRELNDIGLSRGDL